MKRLFLFFIILVGVFGIYSLWVEEQFYFKVFSFIFIPLLTILFLYNRTSLWNRFDYLMILCLTFAYLTDVLNVIDFDTILKIQSQIAFVFVYQLLYIIIFRKEGAFLVHNSFYDSIKIFGPALIVFILFGYFLDESSDLSYFLLFICSIQIVFFVVLALFRPVRRLSYILVALGAGFVFSSDILYVFYFFVAQKLNIYLFSYTFYIMAQVLLVYGLSLNFNEGISKTILSISFLDTKNEKNL